MRIGICDISDIALADLRVLALQFLLDCRLLNLEIGKLSLLLCHIADLPYDFRCLIKKIHLFDNFETLKKIQMQYEMDIITKDEYEEKVRNVLQ